MWTYAAKNNHPRLKYQHSSSEMGRSDLADEDGGYAGEGADTNTADEAPDNELRKVEGRGLEG